MWLERNITRTGNTVYFIHVSSDRIVTATLLRYFFGSYFTFAYVQEETSRLARRTRARTPIDDVITHASMATRVNPRSRLLQSVFRVPVGF